VGTGSSNAAESFIGLLFDDVGVALASNMYSSYLPGAPVLSLLLVTRVRDPLHVTWVKDLQPIAQVTNLLHAPVKDLQHVNQVTDLPPVALVMDLLHVDRCILTCNSGHGCPIRSPGHGFFFSH
jgi:hypothetical protein